MTRNSHHIDMLRSRGSCTDGTESTNHIATRYLHTKSDVGGWTKLRKTGP